MAVPHIFKAGARAKAVEVNENFAYIEDYVVEEITPHKTSGDHDERYISMFNPDVVHPRFSVARGNVTAKEADIAYAPGSGSVWTTWVQPSFTSNVSTGGMSIQLIGSLNASPAGSEYTPFSANGGNVCIAAPCGYLVTFDHDVKVSGIFAKASDNVGWVNAGGAFEVYTDVGRTNKIATVSLGVTYGATATATLASPITTRTLVFYGNASGQPVWNIKELKIFGEYQVSVSTATNLFFKVGGSYPSLEAIYADNTAEVSTSLTTITGLTTNGTYAIIKEKGQNPVAVLSSKVTKGKTLPPTPANGAYHFDTNLNGKSYKSAGGVFMETQWIHLASVTVAGGVITAVASQPYNAIVGAIELPVDKLLVGHITSSCALFLPSIPATKKFINTMFHFRLAVGASLALPAGVDWERGETPLLSVTATEKNRLLLDTSDSGVTWSGSASIKGV